jgi:hypothetical protein
MAALVTTAWMERWLPNTFSFAVVDALRVRGCEPHRRYHGRQNRAKRPNMISLFLVIYLPLGPSCTNGNSRTAGGKEKIFAR